MSRFHFYDAKYVNCIIESDIEALIPVAYAQKPSLTFQWRSQNPEKVTHIKAGIILAHKHDGPF